MPKILLVDDERNILKYYAEELSDDGHQVVAVGSGDQLLSTIGFHQPDVVVLDIKLVGWDGLELLQDIRNRYYDLPVILCSAYEIYKEDLRSLAADYYVVKSFDLSKLKTAIKRATDASLPGFSHSVYWDIQGQVKEEGIMKKNSKKNPGIKLLLKHYKSMFRITENLNYYSSRDYKIAEKKFLKYALLRGND